MRGLFAFQESNGTFSWRKAGTALCFLLFAFSVIGYNFKHNFDQLPDGYLIIISGVFVFYFMKKPVENISFSTKTKVDKNTNID